ncbi:hypothetical protein Mal64_08660 [Pseudobythopirellula maris]|uniref:Uncharacterized protein n=1 Tax=Pseudobythopirellula maris TaxID=2527991 RepID=A0A5C5ZTC9_9BACT|nr:choice-of-anchor Q domain-containing protein [Pseudobythopirellula maris]TWT90476.1 hypothetical protein Mal64_08660 [Pseudobythopirellula maris]
MRRLPASWSTTLTQLGFKRAKPSGSNRGRQPRRRNLKMESLEDRRVLAAVSVSTTLDILDNDSDTSSIAALISTPGSDGEISLREAILAANNTTNVSGNDVIDFDLGAGPHVLNLTDGEIDITDGLDIEGLGRDQLSIVADSNSRIFEINNLASGVSHSFVIDGIEFTGGDRSSGGAISTNETRDIDLTISDSRFVDNESSSGGAIYHRARGSLQVLDTEFSGNSASGAGGAIYVDNASGGVVDVSIEGSSFTDNSANSSGGAIYYTGDSSIEVENSSFGNSHSNSDGGAIYASFSGSAVAPTVSIIDSSISHGSADQGGGLYVSHSSTSGAGGGETLIENSSITHNTADEDGGGIYGYTRTDDHVWKIIGSTISSNTAGVSSGDGGGVALDISFNSVYTPVAYGNSLIIDDSEIAFNTAQGSGGGVSVSTGYGHATPLQISDTFITGNQAGENDAFDGKGKGGGLSLVAFEGEHVIENSKISGNTAARSIDWYNIDGHGGGVFAQLNGSDYYAASPIRSMPVELSITGSDLSENTSEHDGGGLYVSTYRSIFEANELIDAEISVADSTFFNNTSQRGGGIATWLGHGTTFDIVDSRTSGNNAYSEEGFATSVHKGIGGGVYAYFYSDSSGLDKPNLTIAGSTLDDNSADYQGGGIFACSKYNGELVVINSTVSGNQTLSETSGESQGGGVWIGTFAGASEKIDAYFTNTTITQNTSVEGAGIFTTDVDGATTQVNNSIVSDNNDYSVSPAPNNIAGRIDSADSSHNLVGDSPDLLNISGSSISETTLPNVVASDTPFLGELRDNGGPTPTHALLVDSAAIDSGSDALAINPVTSVSLNVDQRGVSRPYDIAGVGNDGTNTVDRGALETHSTGIIVDTDEGVDDNDTSAGDLSLREAIEIAYNEPGHQTIYFDPTFFSSTKTITLASQLLIDSDLTIEGLGEDLIVIDANGASRVIEVASGVAATIGGVTITGGDTTNGGGVYNGGDLTLDHVVIEDNTSSVFGGGVHSGSTATSLTIRDSVVDNNTAVIGGGASAQAGTLLIERSSLSSNQAVVAGGVAPYDAVTSFVVDSSTIAYNEASNWGGGILALQIDSAEVINSTISHNESLNGPGGGIYIQEVVDPVEVTNSTIAYNESTQLGAGIYLKYVYGAASSLLLNNSIVAENKIGSIADDIRGIIDVTSSSNLIGWLNTAERTFIDHGENSNLIGTASSGGVLDPHLAPLGDYGGGTLAHALLADSDAIDNANSSLSPDVDQRGFARSVDGDGVGGAQDDIGAYELQLASVVNTPKDRDIESGELSLRQALHEAAIRDGAETIDFDFHLLCVSDTITLEDQTGDGVADQLVVDSDVTINGLGSELLTVSGDNETRVFHVTAGTTATIEGLAITEGSAADGAGVYSQGDLTLDGVEIHNNEAVSYGGGVYSYGQHVNLTILNSNIHDNDATSTTAGVGGGVGGGVAVQGGYAVIERSSINDNTAGYYGGGFATDDEYPLLTLDIVDSTIALNTAANVGGVALIRVDDTVITNSTISTNTGTSGFGGLFFSNADDVLITNATIANNFSDIYSGVYIVYGSDVTLNNTIVAGNHGTSTDSDIVGSVNTSDSYNNLIGHAATNGGLTDNNQGNIVGVGGSGTLDAKLAALDFYGGPTMTHALLSGSDAIDNGDDSLAPLTDQRGYARPVDGNNDSVAQSDIGAVEREEDSLLAMAMAYRGGEEEEDDEYEESEYSLGEEYYEALDEALAESVGV